MFLICEQDHYALSLYSRLYYPHNGTPTDKVHFEFKLKEAKAIYDALSGEVTAAISCCLKDIRDALTDKRSETKIIYPWT